MSQSGGKKAGETEMAALDNRLDAEIKRLRERKGHIKHTSRFWLEQMDG